ncbi:reverse transcriptase domain-containing protein [Tanacetum coccineum]
MKRLITELPTLTTPMKDEELMVYLSTTEEAISAVLLVERKGSSEASRRLSKWAVKLGAYGISYAPRNAIKALGSKDVPELSKAKEEHTKQDPVAEVDVWKMYANGASNDHGSEAGLILIDPEGMEYSHAFRLNFNNSNNDAEYEALLVGLRIAKGMKVKNIRMFVDSKLVASQVEVSYDARGEKTKKYKEKVQEGLMNGTLVEELNELSVDVAEVNMVVEEERRMWITPIREYMEKGILLDNLAEARTIREKTNNYVIEDEVLRVGNKGHLHVRIPPQTKWGGKTSKPEHNARNQDKVTPRGSMMGRGTTECALGP